MKRPISLTRKRKMILWIVTVGVFFAAVLSLVYGVFMLIVTPDRDSGTIEYRYGEGTRRDITADVPRAAFCPGGVPYVNFASLAEACDFSVSGDENEIRYIIRTQDSACDTVIFYYGSCEISVNGTYYMLSSPVKKQGGWVLVPAEFVTTCMKGVEVEVKNNSIAVVYKIESISLLPDIKPIPPVEA